MRCMYITIGLITVSELLAIINEIKSNDIWEMLCLKG